MLLFYKIDTKVCNMEYSWVGGAMNQGRCVRTGLSSDRGFTLLELMIVVAIIAILTAIALPSYRDYVIRGNLVDGTNELAAYRAQMEQYYQDARQYTTNGTAYTTPCPTAVVEGKWAYACPTLTASTYTITATGSGPAAGFKYSIDQSNAQVTVTVPNTAWGTAGTTHWIMNKGG